MGVSPAISTDASRAVDGWRTRVAMGAKQDATALRVPHTVSVTNGPRERIHRSCQSRWWVVKTAAPQMYAPAARYDLQCRVYSGAQ